MLAILISYRCVVVVALRGDRDDGGGISVARLVCFYGEDAMRTTIRGQRKLQASQAAGALIV